MIKNTMSRRDFSRNMLISGISIAAAGAIPAEVQAERSSLVKTYVLLHGAYHGGWCWNRVAQSLREFGHRVYTPTLTGCGDRVHLLNKDVTLETWTLDILNVLKYEDLEDVIFVSHSFGGLTAMSVVDQAPERLKHVVLLDALLVEPGQSAFDARPVEAQQAARDAAVANGGLAVPAPSLKVFGLEDETLLAEVTPKLTGHPLATYEGKVNLTNNLWRGLPTTYISCTTPLFEPLNPSREIARINGAEMLELPTSHEAMFDLPDELASMLASVG